MLATALMNSFCLSKLAAPTLPEASTRNATSMGSLQTGSSKNNNVQGLLSENKTSQSVGHLVGYAVCIVSHSVSENFFNGRKRI